MPHAQPVVANRSVQSGQPSRTSERHELKRHIFSGIIDSCKIRAMTTATSVFCIFPWFHLAVLFSGYGSENGTNRLSPIGRDRCYTHHDGMNEARSLSLSRWVRDRREHQLQILQLWSDSALSPPLLPPPLPLAPLPSHLQRLGTQSPRANWVPSRAPCELCAGEERREGLAKNPRHAGVQASRWVTVMPPSSHHPCTNPLVHRRSVGIRPGPCALGVVPASMIHLAW